MNTIQKASAALLLFATASAFAGAPAGDDRDTAKAQYEAERARCTSGSTGQDQASCLRSAAAAYDAIRENRLHDANTSYEANAMARCKNLPAADRADCESRVNGEGMQSGSVKAGGDIKETVTVIPATKQ